MEGKLMEQLKEKSFKTTWNSVLITHSLDTILLDNVEQIITKMKENFPSQFYIGDSGMNHIKSPVQYNMERAKWFQDWLGEIPI